MDDDIARAREVLEAFGPVSSRKMFGGAGLYAEGVMFILLAYGVLYLKADDAFAEELEAMGAEQFVYDGKSGKPARMRYWSMPEEALDDPEIAADLARKALGVALAAKR